MKYDVTVVGTASTVSVLYVSNMPEVGISTPVYSDSLTNYMNGGMGLNISAGLASLGIRVYPVLTYTDCRQKDFIHDFATRYDMPQDGIMDPPESAHGTTIMIQDKNKDHMTLITEYDHRRADSTFFGVQQMKENFFSDSKYVILSVPMAMNTRGAIDAIEKSGRPLVFSMRRDPNAMPPELLKKTLFGASYLFANKDEISYICDILKLDNICQLFDNNKMRCIVQTLGVKGSRVYYRASGGMESFTVPAIPPQTAKVETVGAGDGYVSGFMYGLIRGWELDACAILGSTVSSFVLEKEGSITNLPTEERLLERFKKYWKKGI